MTPIQVGVLALQGDFRSHEEHLQRYFSATTFQIRKPEHLTKPMDALFLPGGESSAMLKLMSSGFRETLSNKLREGSPVFATCAGTILLARTVLDPVQFSFGAIDCEVRRNGYGRQRDSFRSEELQIEEAGKTLFPKNNSHLSGIFIRAPRICSVGKEVDVLATFNGEAVLLRGGIRKNIWCASFHPELEEQASEVIKAFFRSTLSSK